MDIEVKKRNIRRGYGSEDRPLTKELWEAESRPTHPSIMQEGSVDPHNKQVDYKRYYDPDYARAEQEKLWLRSWVYACRDEDLPHVGDRMPVRIGPNWFMVVRTAEDSFKAFHNSCLHRGTLLCTHKENAEGFRCPFHAWEWKLDGSLKHIPSHWDFMDVTAKNGKLVEAKLGRWGGFVYINADPDALSFEAALGIVPAHFSDYGMAERHTVGHLRKEVPANWKLVQEAFMESYHVYATHPAVIPFTGDSQSRYDIYSDGVSHVGRQVTPSAVPSMHADADQTRFSATMGQAAFIQMWHHPEAALPALDPAKGELRQQLAQWFRALEAERLGEDIAMTDAALIDSSLYFLFPNTVFWMCEPIPFFYSFTPHESDPTRSYFEVRMLRRLPVGAQHSPVERVDIGIDTPIEGQAPLFGLLQTVFDQDMANLPLVQQGVQSAAKSRAYATLGDYQEFIIQHWNNVLDGIMARP